MIRFNPKLHIGRIRKAFDAGEMQCQQPGFKPHRGCSYAAPCAIGAAFTHEERVFLQYEAAGVNINTLIQTEKVVGVTDRQHLLLGIAQRFHDRGKIEQLDAAITTLEATIR